MRWAHTMRLAAGSAAIAVALGGVLPTTTAADPTPTPTPSDGPGSPRSRSPRRRPHPSRRRPRSPRPSPPRHPDARAHRRPGPSPTVTRSTSPTPTPPPPDPETDPIPAGRSAAPAGRGVGLRAVRPLRAADRRLPRLADRRGQPDLRRPRGAHVPRRRGHAGDGPARREVQRAARVARGGPRDRAAATMEATRARADLAALDTRLEAARAVVREWVFQVYSGGTRRVRRRVHDRGDGWPTPTTSATRSATCPTSPSSAPARSRTSASSPPSRCASAPPPTPRRRRRPRPRARSRTTARRSPRSSRRSAPGSTSSAPLQIAEVEKAGPVASVLVGARTPEAKRAAQRLRDALVAASVDITDIGKPCTNNTTLYPNGLIPAERRCAPCGAPPVSGSPPTPPPRSTP